MEIAYIEGDVQKCLPRKFRNTLKEVLGYKILKDLGHLYLIISALDFFSLSEK